MSAPALVLASSSPRRRELLAAAGVPCRVVPPEDVDETPLPGEAPEALVCRLAAAKAAEVARRYPTQLVLGADTVVWHAGASLGKPADLDEARAFLRRLAGATHQVYTGVSLQCAARHYGATWCSVAHVTFRPLAEAEVEYALSLTNPLDKAGGYAIQEQEAVLIAGHTGCRSTIIGLPVEEVVARLAALDGALNG
jgi:septum formation protein